MKSTAAFKALRKRDANRRNEIGTHKVYFLKKNGEPQKNPYTTHRGIYQFSLDEAVEIKERLEGLNPGTKCVIRTA